MKKKITNRLTLKGLCEAKAQRFLEDVKRNGKHTDLTPQWIYERIKKLLIPGNYALCETCGIAVTFEGITIDHKVAKSDFRKYNGNVHNVENLHLICPSCNSMKGQKGLDEFLKFLEDRNKQILQLIHSHPHEIIAPLFPTVGLGKQVFAKSQNASHKQNKRNKQNKQTPLTLT